ncbi:MAG TPA: hypothetical protein VEZ70_14275 [Allosphingosinicella sp.]|nr:hypothetical protein [Allosphingosinicella sp.]
MANAQDEGRTGSDLQSSQSGGGSGKFGGNRAQQQAQPQGGGATQSDMSQAGGSSGTGGYSSSQNVVNQRDQQDAQGSPSGLAEGDAGAGGGSGGGQMSGQSRGERFDEEQGGGRGVMFDGSGGVSEMAEDQQSHQDRGQSEAVDFERDENEG